MHSADHNQLVKTALSSAIHYNGIFKWVPRQKRPIIVLVFHAYD